MKTIKTFLFDLDGTLLPMDMDKFTEIYFYEMGKCFYGIIDPKHLAKSVWESTKVMVANTEKRTNEEVFWEDFKERLGEQSVALEEQFMKYYNNGFKKVQASTSESKAMIEAVKQLKDKGYEVVVATNPLFPRQAIHDRIRWAGFEPEDFRYVTSFEEHHYCKPQIQYYEELLANLGRKPEECMMVGNNVQEDMVAGKLGLKTWLVTDCLINHTGEDYVVDYEGTADEFQKFSSRM